MSNSSSKGLTELWCPSEILKRSPNIRQRSQLAGRIDFITSLWSVPGMLPQPATAGCFDLWIWQKNLPRLMLTETTLPWKAEQTFKIKPLLYPISLMLCVSSSLLNSVRGRLLSPKSRQQVAVILLLCILHQAGIFRQRPSIIVT